MDVSEYDLPNFEKKLHEISTEEFNKLLIEQVYQTSKIASKKIYVFKIRIYLHYCNNDFISNFNNCYRSKLKEGDCLYK